MFSPYNGKTILVTGGTGSWGTELTKQLLNHSPKEIRIFSRGEFAQVNMKRNFNSHILKFVIGDVRDYEALDAACKGVDFVFHLAALKHVPICEEQPTEAIKTNITGTHNLIKAALANSVQKVIDVSTDKACLPLNVYGMSKAIGERLIQDAGKQSTTTKFIVIRGGNALGSNGSVVPFFIESIKKTNTVPITSSEMTRFFITLSEAVSLLFTAAASNISGALFVMNMPACRIIDLADVLIDCYGNTATTIKVVGTREGEKIHEKLISEQEATNAYIYNDTYYVVVPSTHDDHTGEKVKFAEFTSNDNLMSKQEIFNMLNKGGFLR